MNHLIVRTVDGREFMYEGNEAIDVYTAINNAGARGAEWTLPTDLEGGYQVVFILKNIASFQYK